ncbi:MAG TPA: hypothetical protein VI547_13885, partial [Anaerolineales bacterium]|nr:hypothetical protein [Anaerolineales bacterium]
MSVLLTRVHLPQRRKDLLRRVRLLDVLHRNLHRKLIFLSAPAGYGKTALLLDFAADLDARVCWYTVGPDHANLSTFAQHLIAAFQQRFANFGETGPLKSLLDAADQLEPDSLAAELVNEIVTHVTDFCIVMIDDFQFVGETPIITEFIEVLLEHLPDRVRLIIAGRSVYGIPAGPLYLQDHLATIGMSDLRFRPDELQALVRQNFHISVPVEQAAHLAALADGWAIALMIAARAIERGVTPKISGATDQIYAFLADEVLDRQPMPLRRLMLATAICDEFDEALSNYLLKSQTHALLRELVDRNLFVVEIETGESVTYRYHQLFADFLRNRLSATDPKRAQALHRRAAQWFARHENWRAAV